MFYNEITTLNHKNKGQLISKCPFGDENTKEKI